MKDKLPELLEKRIVILDGAMGTQLQKLGMPLGVCPEKWCIDNPDVLSRIHREYKEAGSDIIYTCTFGANRIKLAQYRISSVVEINKNLALIAREALGVDALIAGDIGPTGKFVKPFGSLDFEEAVDIFKEQIQGLLLGGVDLFVIETMMDIQEARAALIAVKEMTLHFTMVTMTFEKSGRTLNGNDPISALVTLQSLGADALGCNCSSGPRHMLKIISAMKPYATVPLIAKPNAGVPKLLSDKTVFVMSAKSFAKAAQALVTAGVTMIGGCCGTTPEHIRSLREAVRGKAPRSYLKTARPVVTSAQGYFEIGKTKGPAIIGERINPTGKKIMQKELLEGKLTFIRQAAKEQEDLGAKLLDVNVGIPGIDEKKVIGEAISVLSVTTDLPLVIDSSNPEVVSVALRLYPGRALVNSISAEDDKYKKLFLLAKKYGALFILLPIAKKKLPETFKERKAIIKKMLSIAQRQGFSKSDIVIDCLVMSISTNPNSAIDTIKTIRWCTRVLGYNTIVGLSNISFGLPQRRLINDTFLALARKNGLTLAIANPAEIKGKRDERAVKLLYGQDLGGAKFIAYYAKKGSLKTKARFTREKDFQTLVAQAILNGDRESIQDAITQALKTHISPLQLIEETMIPTIIKVGELFEKKKYFLPQLIASAEAMKNGFEYLKPFIKREDTRGGKKAIILMATVEGDVHDIGKNIVSLMLKNHGFEIIDLGRDVAAEKIIQEIKRYEPSVIGLSALMTTTMVNMKKVIELARRENLSCKFMVGGAVLNKRYADSLGAAYAKDGVEAVRVAERLLE